MPGEARRRDLSDFERGVSKENSGFKGCVSVTQLNTLREILGRRLRQRFSPPSIKHQMMECLVEQRCRIPPIEFQTHVESIPGWIYTRVDLYQGGSIPGWTYTRVDLYQGGSIPGWIYTRVDLYRVDLYQGGSIPGWIYTRVD
jgi:hypothetical protein